MRLICVLAALSLLAACATSASSSTAPNASSPGRSASGLASLLASAGQSNAPNLTVVERAMGPADIRRQDGAGLALTYRMESCSLLLLFAADAQNHMHLAVTHPSARRANQPPPSLEQCAEEARARRS